MAAALIMSFCFGEIISYAATSDTVTNTSSDAGTKETSRSETTVAKKVSKKKKRGNCDAYIGLESKYWVLATAKKQIYVYKKKNTKSKTLGKFKKNCCIVVDTRDMKLGKKYKWLKVKMPGNKSGYIQRDKVSLGKLDVETFGLSTKSKKNRQRIEICKFGLPYIGTRFVMGGQSLTKGIDCSSFARRAMRYNGVMVGEWALAVDLSNSGKKIERSQLKPGDMVFYYNSYRNQTIGHCAIYVGNGYIINASGYHGSIYPNGGIRFSKIDYRKPTAVKFRNLVGN